MSKEAQTYEMIFDVSEITDDMPEKEKLEFMIDLEQSIQEKVVTLQNEMKETQIENVTKLIQEKDIANITAQLLTVPEISIDRNGDGDEMIIDIRLVKVLQHKRIIVKMPSQVLQTDAEGNIKNKVS